MKPVIVFGDIDRTLWIHRSGYGLRLGRPFRSDPRIRRHSWEGAAAPQAPVDSTRYPMWPAVQQRRVTRIERAIWEACARAGLCIIARDFNRTAREVVAALEGT